MKRKKKEALPSVRKAFSSVRSAHDDDDSRKKETGEIKYGRSLDCMLDGHVIHLREETLLSPQGGEYDQR